MIKDISLNFPITLNSPITPKSPQKKKTKKNMQNIRLFKIKALPLHRI